MLGSGGGLVGISGGGIVGKVVKSCTLDLLASRLD